MNIRYNKHLEDEICDYARKAAIGFTQKFSDEASFEARLRAGLKFSGNDPDLEKKIQLTKNSLGLFSLELFQAMICAGDSFKPAIVSIMWDRLNSAGLILKSIAPARLSLFADSQIDQQRLLQHLQDGTFENIFALPSRLPETYASAVASVDVLNKDGDLARGTGFIVNHQNHQYFVTCKHNVDPDDGIVMQAITSSIGSSLSTGDFALSDRYDIAVAPLHSDIFARCFVLSDEVEIFDEVFTLGYPLVPRADSVLVGHRGEMNARAQLYTERCPILLISNLVSPGSSGGPVLTRDGHCVGMTINWLEGEREAATGDQNDKAVERMRFSAALPASLLIEALNSLH